MGEGRDLSLPSFQEHGCRGVKARQPFMVRSLLIVCCLALPAFGRGIAISTEGRVDGNDVQSVEVLVRGSFIRLPDSEITGVFRDPRLSLDGGVSLYVRVNGPDGYIFRQRPFQENLVGDTVLQIPVVTITEVGVVAQVNGVASEFQGSAELPPGVGADEGSWPANAAAWFLVGVATWYVFWRSAHANSEVLI